MVDLDSIVEGYLDSFKETDTASSTVDLRILWQGLEGGHASSGLESNEWDASDEGYLAFIAAAHTLDRTSGEQLDLRAGGWTVDATGGLIRTGLCGALLTGVLALAGVTALSPVILPAVLPLLFDVRRARVSASHQELLAEIVVLPGIAGKVLTARELYAQLPIELKDDVSPLEIAGFLDELHTAGLADKKEGGYVLRPPDKARFRVTWR